MRIRVGILLLTFFALLAWAYSASAADNLFKKAAGHYEGTLTSFEKGQYTRLLVKTDLASDKDGMKNIIIKSEEGTDLLVFELSKIGNKDFIIGGPFVDSQIKLKKDNDDDCFTESTNLIDFCFFRDAITIEITNKAKASEYAISLNRFAQVRPPPLEEPKVYDLQTALDHAWSFNFDNRIEFEHVMQAKYGALAAKRLLTPHISFTTIVNNIKPTILSVIGAAGDLLPFLFPTRWLQASHAAILSQAEQDGMTLMRLDTATQIEAQFYALENYRQLQAHYAYALKKAKQLTDIISLRVRGGVAKPITVQDFFTMTGEIQDDAAWITDQFEAQKGAIAQVMGFYNMAAVKDAEIGTEALPITKATPLVMADITNIAEDRSIELKQLQFLIDAAGNSKKQVYWNWLDPTGDPTLGLGWALKSSVNVADSMVREAVLRKGEMQRQLAGQAGAAVNDYNTALNDYPLVAKLEEAQAQRIEQYETELKGNGKEDTDRAIGLLQDYINEDIKLQFDMMTFRTARARVDRLLLQGFYVKGTLPPKINRDPLKK
jgi:hypothetical protein